MAGDAALTGYGGSNDATLTALGLRGEHAMTFGTMYIILKGMIGWQHVFGDTVPIFPECFEALLVLSCESNFDGGWSKKKALSITG